MHTLIRLATLCALLFLNSEVLAQLPSAFTYQGRLKLSGVPVSDSCDFQVSLWNAASGGQQLAGPQTFPSVVVTKGLFVLTPDFGFDIWDGSARFLQIAVRCPAGSGSPYTPLAPRQSVSPVPYALYAEQGGDWDFNPATNALSYSGGNVGIGTTIPQHPLSIVGSAADLRLAIENTASGGEFFHLISTGVGSQVAAGSLRVYAAQAGVDRMVIGPSGNVGIGMTNPQNRLEVKGSVVVDAGHQNVGPGAGIGLFFGVGSGEAIVSRRSTGAADSLGLSFFTGLGRRMLIAQSGQVAVGMDPFGSAKLSVFAPTANDVAMYVGGAIQSDKNLVLAPGISPGYDGTVQVAPFSGYGLSVGFGGGSGNLAISGHAYKFAPQTWESASDRRIKTDVEPVHDAVALACAVQAVRYRYSPAWCEKYGLDSTAEWTGVIAQDYARVFPQAVHEGPFELPGGDGKALVVDTSDLPFVAVAAIKELDARNMALEETLSHQAAEIAELKAQLARIETLLNAKSATANH